MSLTAISAYNISKRYHLGDQKDGSLTGSFSKWIRKFRQQPDAKDFWALQDITFDIKEGEVFGIIGRNGAGKSTLLKLLSKITYPTTGSITYYGKIASLLEVGTGFHPELTGRENIYLNGTLLGMTRKEVSLRLEEIVDFSGIETFIDTPVKHYSSGMYVRLAFSVAAHLEPDIMIIDEVLAVGDADFQRKCLGKMGEVSREKGRTVLFVSHNMSAINSLCQKGMLLENGKLAMMGDIEAVTKQYLMGGEEKVRHTADFSGAGGIGDQQAKVIRVCVTDPKGKGLDYYRIDEELILKVEYTVLSDICNPKPSFHIFTDNGERILVSVDTDKDSRRLSGTYESVCRIPANFFNEGTYIIGISLATLSPLINHNIQHHLLTIRIKDVPEAITRNTYGGRFPGVIRPLFLWETEKKKS